MAAWGATGVLGAGLARTGLSRGGRWGLAIACCAAGFAFTAFQDVGDWVTFSDHSWAQLGVYVGQGLGFDAIHAAGCLAFALAFGPALTRSIQRFARRLEVTWLPAAPLAVGLIAVVMAGAAAAPSRAQAAGGPAGYLLGAQNSDGGFGVSAGQPSNQLYAGWAALGLASAGYDLNHVAHGGASVIDYVRSGAGSADAGSLERTILVARAAGQSARSFGGHDLIGALLRHLGANGSVSGQVNLTAFAVLALRSDGVDPAGPHAGLARAPAEPATADSASPAPAARVMPTTPARRSRRSPAPPAVLRRFEPARSPTCAASRTATEALPPSRGAAPTPSRQRGRSRASMPPAWTRTACAAALAPPSPTCGR